MSRIIWRVDLQHASADGAFTRFFEIEREANACMRKMSPWGWLVDAHEVELERVLSEPQMRWMLTLSWPVIPLDEIAAMASLASPTMVQVDPDLSFTTT